MKRTPATRAKAKTPTLAQLTRRQKRHEARVEKAFAELRVFIESVIQFMEATSAWRRNYMK